MDPEDVMRILDAANQDETDLQRNITSFEQREDDSSRLSVPPSPEIQIKVRSSPPDQAQEKKKRKAIEPCGA